MLRAAADRQITETIIGTIRISQAGIEVRREEILAALLAVVAVSANR